MGDRQYAVLLLDDGADLDSGAVGKVAAGTVGAADELGTNLAEAVEGLVYSLDTALMILRGEYLEGEAGAGAIEYFGKIHSFGFLSDEGLRRSVRRQNSPTFIIPLYSAEFNRCRQGNMYTM